jgi:hypothetical protein
MIGKVPFGVAGTSSMLAIGMYLITGVPSIGAEVPAGDTGSISVVESVDTADR